MREILFRGKRASDKKWIEGGIVVLDPDSDYVFISEPYYYASTLPVRELIYDRTYLVGKETVGQYTGLTDKNGKKIFEWDIITYFEEIENVCYNNLSYRETTGIFEPNRVRHNEKFTGIVSFDKDFCGYIVKPVNSTCHITYTRKSLKDHFIKNIEVIGNIFDNPELIASKKGAEA